MFVCKISNTTIDSVPKVFAYLSRKITKCTEYNLPTIHIKLSFGFASKLIDLKKVDRPNDPGTRKIHAKQKRHFD